MSQEIIELLEKVAELLYQETEGFCPWCGAKDYPVCGDKQGYDEVKPEEVEEWIMEHSENCLVSYIDQTLELSKQQPPASEFTNDVKFVVTALKNCKKINPKNPLAVAEAIPDLLTACEYTEILLSKGIGQHTHALALIESARAKAKKEPKVIKKHGGCWPQANNETSSLKS